MYDIDKFVNKKLLTPTFFKKFQKVALYDKEDIWFKHDRFSIINLGINKGYKMVELSNCNACAPFDKIIIGVNIVLVDKWYVDHEYEITFEDGEKFKTKKFIDNNDIIAEIVVNGEHHRFIDIFGGCWGLDCPKWIDRIGIFNYLTDCLDCFKNEK